MDVGELRELIASLPDNTPIVGRATGMKEAGTEEVHIDVGRCEFTNGVEFDPALRITIELRPGDLRDSAK